MKGRPTLWLPGTDHAGIATQLLAICGICLLKSQVYSTPRSIALCPKCFLCDLKYLMAVALVVAAAAVVDCPPPTNTAGCATITTITFASTIAVVVVAAATVVDCPPQTLPSAPPIPQLPLPPPVNYMGKLIDFDGLGVGMRKGRTKFSLYLSNGGNGGAHCNGSGCLPPTNAAVYAASTTITTATTGYLHGEGPNFTCIYLTVAMVVLIAMAAVVCPPQTPPSTLPVLQSPLPPPVIYMVVVVASAAVVNSPQKRSSAPPVPQPLLPPHVNYIVVVVAAATVVDCPRQTPPSAPPVPQPPPSPLVKLHG
ncbi:hypothetical protein G2W53_021577 [Senna tora]|uniref:Uncharacterized protein n=1 Tax=Senna tora TaxID=362788 RepID=A0A834TJV0_9FABA|nr:hypothetical protein G2W53_021577 [Senna tora]